MRSTLRHTPSYEPRSVVRSLSTPLRVLLAPAHWLERARGRRRLALALAYSLVVLVVGVLFWRQSRLAGLPNVAIPFDPQPLLSLAVPDDRNAFVLYRQARLKLKRDQTIERRIFGMPYAWPAKDEAALAFLKSNDEAVELWKEASDRPDALPCPVAELGPETGLPEHNVLRPFFWHAMTRASREEARGDVAAAWVWYRALIRSSRHAARHAPWIGRVLGRSHDTSVLIKIAAWSADPRVEAPLLGAALKDVLDANAMTPPDREAIELAYIEAMKTFQNQDQIARLLMTDRWDMGEVDKTAWQSHLPALRRIRWFLANEPERSRRVARLCFANWFEHFDDPPSRRPRLVGTTTMSSLVFDAWFSSPPEARAIAPARLASELESAILTKTLSLDQLGRLRQGIDRDHAQRAAMVLTLARQLHAREHGGSLPKTDEELVGTYLDRMPHDPTRPASNDPGVAAR
jgi:hypothetical protein